MSSRSLNLFRQFYIIYPQILQTVSAKLQMPDFERLRSKFTESVQAVPQRDKVSSFQLLTDNREEIVGVNPEELVKHISFSQFTELIRLDDPLKRAFYEIECINGNWSFRELKRQIRSLYFERSGLSKNKNKLSEYTRKKAAHIQPEDIVRDPFFFEFLGLKEGDTVLESDLEKALLDNLQAFMLELGHGFCFEARQKRITIDNNYFYVDLVFYHRILKCHVLIELKVDGFDHANFAKLNTYLNYYKRNEMREDDKPPIGILLCTDKSDMLVEYATGGMENTLFVSKYQIALPTKEEFQKFIENEIAKRNASSLNACGEKRDDAYKCRSSRKDLPT